MVVELSTILSSISSAANFTEQKITNHSDLLMAVQALEAYPMTRHFLEQTRIGKVLNEVRRFADPALNKRIKAIIKTWQPLLTAADSNYSVVPIPCEATRLKNATIKQSSSQPHLTSLLAHSRSESTPDFRQINGDHRSLSPANNIKPDRKIDDNAAEHKSICSGSTGTGTNRSSRAPGKIAKLRSTAELISSKDGVSRETRTKILNNEIVKEPVDESPATVTVLQRKRLHRESESSSTGPNKSALLDKFLSNAIDHPNKESPFLTDSPELMDTSDTGESRIRPDNSQDLLDGTVPLTIFSTTHDSESIHILPWVDLEGWRREFFPLDSVALDFLDRDSPHPEEIW